MPTLFEGFDEALVDVGGTDLFMRRKGDGAPVLLLHGFPQTHLMWRHIAPDLARRFTVVCADLRGYGASGKPASAADHAPYSKRVMALDMVQLMKSLGFTTFHVVGHDRGGRVAYRMALDHPQNVRSLVLLDIIPTEETLARADARLALGFWPWSLLAQPHPLPERLIGACPHAVVDDALSQWGSMPSTFAPDVRQAYVDALGDPRAVHAICEEYRAAATIDAEHDRHDQAHQRRIQCPTLALWSANSALDCWYGDAGGPLGIWRRWADRVTGRAMRGGHFFAEENPAETLHELERFLGSADAATAQNA